MDQNEKKRIMAAVRAQFPRDLGYVGCTIRERTLKIYIKDESCRGNFPETFEGLPVELKVNGDIIAGSNGSPD